MHKKFTVKKWQNGWIVTRKSDGFKIYFESEAEMKKFIAE